MDGKFRYLLAPALSALLLVGCTPAPTDQPPAEVAQEEPGASDQSAEEQSNAQGPEEADDVASKEPVEADEEVMASMTCTELDLEALEKLDKLYHFGNAVSVEVGEVNGKTWWVVAGRAGTSSDWKLYCFLTNDADYDFDDREKWVDVTASKSWIKIDWDHDSLVRMESALALAKERLATLDWMRGI